ncbi:MAG: protein kinase [Eubacteriales bacterium]|nr:protein kinase [Eubacteriales bacterium]
MEQIFDQSASMNSNHQQPRLSDNHQVIKPVRHTVCPEAVELLSLIRHRALPVLRGIETLSPGEGLVAEPCFLFDFLPGTSLDKLTEAECVDWTIEQRIRYFAELALVIDFLHQQGSHGLMHLDIKPANLLLDPYGRPALIDFDTLQFADALNKQDAATTSVTCTLGYAAPEVIHGRPVRASDFYAFGLCLVRWFTDFDPDQIEPARLPVAVNTLHPALAAVTARCLMTNPDDRLANGPEIATQLLDALQAMNSPLVEVVEMDVNAAAEVSELCGHATDGEADVEEASDVGVEAGVEAGVEEALEAFAEQSAPFPKTTSYSRVISIWDGAEFGCELAVQLRHYYAHVLVIDGDLIHPQADLLLGKKSRKTMLMQQSGTDNLNLALAEVSRNVLTPGRLREMAWPSLNDQVDLLVFGDKLDEYDHLPPASFLKLLDVARQSYPVIVLLLNRFIYDAFTCLGLMTAEQVLIPTLGCASAFRAFNQSIDYLSLRRQIDPDRVRFVAFPYDQRTDLSLGTLNVLADNRLIGSIQTNLARQRRRGSARPYACAVSPVNEKEYDGIIARLNHQSRKESPDADRHIPRPIRRTIRLLSRPTLARA